MNPQQVAARRRQNRTGWAMALPACALIFLFLITPFIMAFGLSLTNQRLISPNPTEFVGLRNFERLLGLGLLHLEPTMEEGGGFARAISSTPASGTLLETIRITHAWTVCGNGFE